MVDLPNAIDICHSLLCIYVCIQVNDVISCTILRDSSQGLCIPTRTIAAHSDIFLAHWGDYKCPKYPSGTCPACAFVTLHICEVHYTRSCWGSGTCRVARDIFSFPPDSAKICKLHAESCGSMMAGRWNYSSWENGRAQFHREETDRLVVHILRACTASSFL